MHFSLARFRETQSFSQLLVAPYKIYQQTRTHRVWQLGNATNNNKKTTHLSRDSFYARRIAFRPKKHCFCCCFYFFFFIVFVSQPHPAWIKFDDFFSFLSLLFWVFILPDKAITRHWYIDMNIRCDNYFVVINPVEWNVWLQSKWWGKVWWRSNAKILMIVHFQLLRHKFEATQCRYLLVVRSLLSKSVLSHRTMS